jgi:hypothetical protein
MAGRPKYEITERHLDYATPGTRGVECVKLRLEGLTIDEIGKALGMQPTNVTQVLRRVYQAARDRGYDPQHELDGAGLPEGQRLAGVTNQYRFVDGKRVLASQYVLGRRAKDVQTDEIIEAIESACANIKPCKPIKSPRKVKSDLCNLIHVTDYHLAALCWEQETGEAWDSDIAERQFVSAITELVETAPDAGIGIFSQGGDFLHYDSLEAVTPTAKNVLEADSRAGKMVEIALNLHVFAIQEMLKKHRRVVVIIQEGNHDLMGSVWLRKSLKQYYRNNKRVEVVDTEFPYYAYVHGQIFLGFHHGHKKKNKELPSLFASEPRYRALWGRAKYSYIHTGHYHQREQDQSEFGGAVVERHATLAARDSHATRGGYVSWRGMNCITYHKTKGEVSRRTVSPEQQ